MTIFAIGITITAVEAMRMSVTYEYMPYIGDSRCPASRRAAEVW